MDESDPFREISEIHSAHEASQERDLRGKSLLASMALLAGAFTLASIAGYLFYDSDPAQALEFGAVCAAGFFVLALGFKIGSFVALDGFQPFPRAMALAVVFALLTPGFVVLTSALGPWAFFPGLALLLVATGASAARLYQVSLGRGVWLSFLGAGSALLMWGLFVAAALRILYR